MTYKKEYTNLAEGYSNFRDEKHNMLACMIQNSFLCGRINSWLIVVGKEFVI